MRLLCHWRPHFSQTVYDVARFKILVGSRSQWRDSSNWWHAVDVVDACELPSSVSCLGSLELTPTQCPHTAGRRGSSTFLEHESTAQRPDDRLLVDPPGIRRILHGRCLRGITIDLHRKMKSYTGDCCPTEADHSFVNIQQSKDWRDGLFEFGRQRVIILASARVPSLRSNRSSRRHPHLGWPTQC